MQSLPSVELSKFIKRYFFLKATSSVKKTYRLFSNGNTGLVFSINKEANSSRINGSLIMKVFVFGQIITPIEIELEPNSELAVVAFTPNGLNELTGVPGIELKGCVIEADNVFGKNIQFFQEALVEKESKNDITDSLNEYLLTVFVKQGVNKNPELQSIIQKIADSKGDLSIRNIKEEYFIHEKKLQRMFSNQIGMSAKSFIQITKLNTYLELLQSKSLDYSNLTSMAYEVGYYDQSHLVKSFKSITGLTPTQYLDSPILAMNLIEIK